MTPPRPCVCVHAPELHAGDHGCIGRSWDLADCWCTAKPAQVADIITTVAPTTTSEEPV
jgi:hypothetical protein